MITMVLAESVRASLRYSAASPPELRGQMAGALKSFVAQWLTGLLQTARSANAD